MEEEKQTACSAIDEVSEQLNNTSQELWKNPEVGYQETHAHKVLTAFLQEQGFSVERQYKLPTAFRAIYSRGEGPNVAVICEYDALPEIGHACGHNLIAEAGIGAAVGIKAAMQKVARDNIGKLTVLGTPAEEAGGGKIDLIRAGAFDDVDAAMMVHPDFCTLPFYPGCMAMTEVRVKYKGRPSHAAVSPWDGVNALDAAVMAYNAVSSLRQQMKPDWRIHGVFINGGTKSNIIPEESELEYCVRTTSNSELDTLIQKATACFEGAAKATGCSLEMVWSDKGYAAMRNNEPMARRFSENGKQVGIVFDEHDPSKHDLGGSTDMGNVSIKVPSIHPMFRIGTPAFTHTREFAVTTGSQYAQPYTLNQAKAMAMTALDIYFDKDLLADMKNAFQKGINIC